MNLPSPEARLAAVDIEIPVAPRPRGAYAPFCCQSLEKLQLVTISGQTCRVNGRAIEGICDVGTDLSEPRYAAQVAMLNCLSALRASCGSTLTRVVQVVRVRGFIRSTSAFKDLTSVLDAASNVLQMAFPEQRLPARTAVGVSSLPDCAWIEIELDALVKQEDSECKSQSHIQ